MRFLWIDIDSLRPDHLGCYGYHRDTSPNIDRVARDGIRFNNVFVPDAPCLPSRTALQCGRFGIHTGVINHGGTYADPWPEGPERGFKNSRDYWKWMQVLQAAGVHTASISSFAGRHNCWHFLAGFNEVYDCGKSGNELATEVVDRGLEFLDRKGGEDNWFLHFNIWDPHTPYRTPEEFGEPFQEEPVADWVTQEMIDRHYSTYGTHGANAPLHRPGAPSSHPREVDRIRTLEDYKKWVNGYDTGILFADQAVGRLLEKLDDLDLYEETVVVVTADHGENQGELGVYGDHQTADLITCRVPMIVKWPGMKPRQDNALHYQFDVAATFVEMLGTPIPAGWDAESFAESFRKESESGRDHLVVSQGCWACQRGVIFDEFILLRTYMDGLKDWPELMLFDRERDPHELQNLAEKRPEVVDRGLAILQRWLDAQMNTSGTKVDPMMKVIAEGGPFHTRRRIEEYLTAYRKMGLPELADRMEKKYADQPGYWASPPG
jgi:arylsulfatase A-like enzyme